MSSERSIVQFNLNVDDYIPGEEESIPIKEVIPAEANPNVDTTEPFTTSMGFDNRTELIDWMKRIGRNVGVIVVIGRSEVTSHRRPARVDLICERGGKFDTRPRIRFVDKKIIVKRQTGSKKCGCPFKLRAIENSGKWFSRVICGIHNHPLIQDFEGHSYAGKLLDEEYSVLQGMSVSGMRPRDILTHLKSRDPTNVSSIRNIYNARTKLRIQETCGRTNMQQLMKLIYEHGYIERHRMEAEGEVVSDIFFAHPTSIQLIRAFPLVFIMDCTYKTNRYRLPLLEIVGITSTGKTFAAAFVYLRAEKEDNFAWALECFKTLFDESPSPKVIITDHELGLMKAISVVFPNTMNFLCRWHIEKNIVKNCKKAFSEEAWKNFMDAWSQVMRASSEEDYTRKVTFFANEFENYPHVISYIRATWLDKHKERFVSAWTNRHMHLDNSTTNRVEGHHAKLKKYLGTSIQNFVNSWQTIHNLLELQISNIRASLEESLTKIPHKYRGFLFQDLIGVVSIYALQKIEHEVHASDGVGPNNNICNHVIHTTCGLPCAHKIAEYRHKSCPIPLSVIHPFWRKLCMTPFIEDYSDVVDIAPEIELLMKRFTTGNMVQRKEIKKSLKKLSDPAATLLLEPTVKVNTRGRKKNGKKRAKAIEEESTKRNPSGFEYVLQSVERSIASEAFPPAHSQMKNRPLTKQSKIDVQRSRLLCHRFIGCNKYKNEFPDFLSPFIVDIRDVPGDGHCGYRVVAAFLGMSNEGWRDVRNDLLLEIEQHPDEYNLVFYGLDRVEEVKRSLRCQTSIAGREHWMTMPEMGYVISSYYKIVVVLISMNQCLTFFPIRDPPPPASSHRILCIGYVGGCHFQGLELTPDAPLPPVTTTWERFHLDSASSWVTSYISRMEVFRSLAGSNVALVDVVDLV